MTRIKRPAAAVGAVALLAFSLTACGGSDAPTDASKDEFCEAYLDTSWIEDIGEEDYEGFVDAAKERAEELEEIGTPDDIPDDAREGFEIELDAARDLDADDVREAIEEQDADFLDVDEDDQKKYEALSEYVADECGTPGLPSDLPTDLPSDLPTDLSELPTDPSS